MISNPGRNFVDAIPRPRRILGTVTAHYADGTAAFQLPEGTYCLVRGALDATPPYRAFVVGGVIESRASTADITAVATEG